METIVVKETQYYRNKYLNTAASMMIQKLEKLPDVKMKLRIQNPVKHLRC